MSVAQLQRSPMVLEDDEQPRLLSPGRTGSQGRLAHREDMKVVDVPVNYTTLSMFEAQRTFWIVSQRKGEQTGV